MCTDKTDRIVKFGKAVWSLLTEDERERYGMNGTLTFIEDIFCLLNVSYFDWSDVKLIESIHDKIFG